MKSVADRSSGVPSSASPIRDNVPVLYTPIPQVDDTVAVVMEKPRQHSPRQMMQRADDKHNGVDNGSNLSANRRRAGAGHNQDKPSRALKLMTFFRDYRTSLRILTFITAICTLASVVDGPHLIAVFCKNNIGAYLSYSYPYKLNKRYLYPCEGQCALTNVDRCSAAAQFLVFASVISIAISPLYALCTFYLSSAKARYDLFMIVAFATDAILAVIWFAGSIAWAAAVSEIRQLTRRSYIAGILQAHGNFEDCTIFTPTNGSLVVSIILGFVNCVLWAISAFLAFKASNLFNRQRRETEPRTQSPEIVK